MALVLCTGVDKTLLQIRRFILEREGHAVVTVMDENNLTAICQRHSFDVVVTGQAVSPNMKLRIALLVRQHCPGAKILEPYPLYAGKVVNDADKTAFRSTLPPGIAVHLHLLKFAFLLARLCSRLSFTLPSRTQAKCNICQLQKPVAFRWLKPRKFPIAFEHCPFKTGRRSNPQFVPAISLFAVLAFLALLG